MIDLVLKFILLILVLFLIVLPVCVSVFKEQVWIYIEEKLKEQEKHERLKRDMKQRKKGNQGKTLLK